MKPLDLNVSIQNSYEAARSESVRLDKPGVISRLGNEDAKRDQIQRDESVAAPEPQAFTHDPFPADAYNEPDYTSGDKKNRSKKKRPEIPEKKESAEKTDGTTAVEEEPDGHHNFSTFA